MFDERFAGGPVASHNVDYARGQCDFLTDFREQQRRERRKLSRLQDDRVPSRESRRNFPCQHEQRKIPRNDLSHNAARDVLGKFLFEQLRPSGMMIEMPRHQRNVDIAALADRLSIVHRLEDREKPGVLLNLSRNRIQVASPSMGCESLPLWRRCPRGLNGCIHIGGRSLGGRRQLLSVGGVEGIEVSARRWFLPGTVDEMFEAPVMTIQPGRRLFRVLRSGAILHGRELFGNAHSSLLDSFFPTMQWDGDALPSSVPSRGAPVAAQCLPTNCSRQSGTILRAPTTIQVPLSSWIANRAIV